MTGLVFSAAKVLLLRTVIISRLARLGASVKRIGVSKDLAAWVSMQGRDALSDLAGNINEMLAALVRSESERQQAEAALRESAEKIRHQARNLMLANAQLTKASQAKSESLSHISHELRSPLIAALAFA